MENIPGILFLLAVLFTAALTILAVLMPLWVWLIYRTMVRIERAIKAASAPRPAANPVASNPIRLTR